MNKKKFAKLIKWRKPFCNIANETINFAIDLCNAYFESPAGKEYLNMRKKIDYLGR